MLSSLGRARLHMVVQCLLGLFSLVGWLVEREREKKKRSRSSDHYVVLRAQEKKCVLFAVLSLSDRI